MMPGIYILRFSVLVRDSSSKGKSARSEVIGGQEEGAGVESDESEFHAKAQRKNSRRKESRPLRLTSYLCAFA
jgi:hypothetical protein